MPQRRVKTILINLQGEQHQLPTLPQGVLPIFSEDWVMDPKIDMDLFLNMHEIDLIEHDDVMVIFFIHALTCLAYEWYMSLPTGSISSFNDLETMFMTMYDPPITYHTFLTWLT
jgi:hypothetical protein